MMKVVAQVIIMVILCGQWWAQSRRGCLAEDIMETVHGTIAEGWEKEHVDMQSLVKVQP